MTSTTQDDNGDNNTRTAETRSVRKSRNFSATIKLSNTEILLYKHAGNIIILCRSAYIALRPNVKYELIVSETMRGDVMSMPSRARDLAVMDLKPYFP